MENHVPEEHWHPTPAGRKQLPRMTLNDFGNTQSPVAKKG